MSFRRAAFRGIKAALVWSAPFAWLLLVQTPALGALKDIPNVVGQKLAMAQRILQQDKFKVEATPEATFFPGEHLKVFRQYPRPGSAPGGWNGVVKIWYYDNNFAKKADGKKNSASKGPGTPHSRLSGLVSVPMLKGLMLSQALEKLRKAGLNSVIAGSVFTGNRKLMLKVADQNPPPGTLVQPKSLVSVYLFRLRDYKTPREIQKELRKKAKKKRPEPSDQD